jgi:hypothetical protein
MITDVGTNSRECMGAHHAESSPLFRNSGMPLISYMAVSYVCEKQVIKSWNIGDNTVEKKQRTSATFECIGGCLCGEE